MSSKGLKEKATKGIFWGGVSNGIQQISGIIFGIILLKNLTAEDYGLFGMLAIFTGIANTIQESGFTSALTNRKIFNPEDYNSVFWFNIFVGSFIYIILFFCAPYIAEFYNQPILIPLSRILFLSIITGSFGIAHNAVLFRSMLVKERAKIDACSILAGGITGVILAILGFGYWALAIQTLITSLFSTLLRWFFVPWRPCFAFSIVPIKEMFSFSSRILLSTIINQVQANINLIMLGRFYNPVDVGYYSQGTKWPGMLSWFINGTMSNILQPLFVQLNEDKEKQLQSIRKIVRFLSFLSFPILFGMAFISFEFISIINTDWLISVPVLQLFCIWNAFSTFNVLFSQLVISTGRSRFYLWINILSACIQLIAIFIFISYGLYIVAIINIVVFLLVFLLWIGFVQEISLYNFGMFIRDISPYLLIVIIDFSIVYLITYNVNDLWLKLISKIILAAIIYISVLFYLKSKILYDVFYHLRKILKL